MTRASNPAFQPAATSVLPALAVPSPLGGSAASQRER